MLDKFKASMKKELTKEETLGVKALVGIKFLSTLGIMSLYFIFRDNQEVISIIQKAIPYDTLWFIMIILYIAGTIEYIIAIPQYVIRRIKHVR